MTARALMPLSGRFRRPSRLPSWLPRDGAGAPAVMWRDHLDGRFFAGGAVHSDLASFNAAASRTFTRSTTKTRRSAAGAPESVAINVEALEWEYGGAPLGLSLEGSRQNYWPDSEFTGGTSGLSAVANVMPVSDMEGGRTGLAFDNSAGLAYALRTIAGTSGMTTVSVYVETEDGAPPVFGGISGASSANTCAIAMRGVFIDPTTYKVERCGARTWRVSGSSDAAGASSHFGLYQYQTNEQRRIKATGFQLEGGAFVSSYIPTGASFVTRGADIDVHTAGAAPFTGFDQTQGCVIWEGDLSGLIDYQYLFLFGVNGTNHISVHAGSTGFVRLLVIKDGYTQASPSSPAGLVTPGARFRVVCAYTNDRFELWCNGAKVGEDTAGIVPEVAALNVMRWYSTGYQANGHLARFGYLAAPPWDRLAALSQIGGV